MPGSEDTRRLEGLLANILRRLRQVEIHRHPLAQTFFQRNQCITLQGSGTETDPYLLEAKIADLPNNQLACTEDGLFVGSGQNVGWDATVDNSIVNSDPDARLFQTPGEAMDYLANTVGLSAVGIAVRSTGTAYVEPADWDAPATVRLFGIRGVSRGTDGGVVTGGVAMVEWQWSTFEPNNACSMQMDDIALLIPAFTAKPFSSLTAQNCAFQTGSTSYPTGVQLCDFFTGLNCSIYWSGNSGAARTWATKTVLTDCDVRLRAESTTSPTFVLGSSYLIVNGGRLGAAGTFSGNIVTISLPINFSVKAMNSTDFESSTSQSLPRRFSVPSGSRGSIHMTPASLAPAANWDVVATSGFVSLECIGAFRNITVGGSHDACSIDGQVYEGNGASTWDITGPATVRASADDEVAFILRGNAVNAHIAASGLILSSGTFLSLIAADFCNVTVAANGAGASGTHKSYNLDASSDKNLLTFAGDSTFPVAGTDAGTANLVTVT